MKQDKALAVLKSGKNVFLTGSAGTGKTHVLTTYISYLKDHKVPVAITASTGIAATHIGGMTIHSWSGIGVRDNIDQRFIRGLKEKKYLTKQIENTHVLIIDEISMLHKRQLDMINQVTKSIRNSHEPFGGMQVVFSGDFFQLPPVDRQGLPSREKFCFMSQAWVDADLAVCYLTEQYRQANNRLQEILSHMRTQKLTPADVNDLNKTEKNTLEDDATRLYTHNEDVDKINNDKLADLPGTVQHFKAKKTGNPKMLEGFLNGLLVSERMSLKEGAKVMFVKNNHEKGIMNGMLGEIKEFKKDYDGDLWPLVRLYDGRNIMATPELWEIRNEENKKLVGVEQVPLRLAWAITVHKSQGMTLDAAEVDLSQSFEPGQGYVALSRLKDLSGLKLLGLNKQALTMDSLSIKADRRFKELSAEVDAKSIESYEKEHENHILRSGGTTDKKAVARSRSKRKTKEEKVNTYEQTANLLKTKSSIKDIAEMRGLSESTIMGHILKISKDYPDVDISYYRPPKKVMDDISAVYEDLESKADPSDYSRDGMLSSKLVFEALKGKYSYSQIKQAYAYL